jgi:hypothetical protein
LTIDELVQLACHKTGVTDFGIMMRSLENIFSVGLANVSRQSIDDKFKQISSKYDELEMECITNSESQTKENNYFMFNQSPVEEGKQEDDPFSAAGFFKKNEETIESLTNYACNFKQNCDKLRMEKAIQKTLFSKETITKLWSQIEENYMKSEKAPAKQVLGIIERSAFGNYSDGDCEEEEK